MTYPDNKQDNPDVLSALENIKNIYEALKVSLNYHSQASLKYALALEAETLLLKLRTMHKRWDCNLPFKEACNVKFGEWMETIARMTEYFNNPDNYTIDGGCYSKDHSKHFLLDLIDLLPDEPEIKSLTDNNDYPYYAEKDVKRLVERQNQLKKELSKDCIYYMDRFSDSVKQQYAVEMRLLSGGVEKTLDEEVLFCQTLFERDLEKMPKGNYFHYTCLVILTELQKELGSIEECVNSDMIPDHLFERLYDRLYVEYGKKSVVNARYYFTQWMRKTSPRCLDTSRDIELDIVKTRLEKFYIDKIHFNDYFDTDQDISLQKPLFGRFLFATRENMTIKQVEELIADLHLLCLLRENKKKRSVGKTADKVKKTTDQEKIIKKVKDNVPAIKTFLTDKFANNEAAVLKLIEIFIDLETQINKGKKLLTKFRGLKWEHVYTAFDKMQFIPHNTAYTKFAMLAGLIFLRLSCIGFLRPWLILSSAKG